jgi:hypothetical protein
VKSKEKGGKKNKKGRDIPNKRGNKRWIGDKRSKKTSKIRGTKA